MMEINDWNRTLRFPLAVILQPDLAIAINPHIAPRAGNIY